MKQLLLLLILAISFFSCKKEPIEKITVVNIRDTVNLIKPVKNSHWAGHYKPDKATIYMSVKNSKDQFVRNQTFELDTFEFRRSMINIDSSFIILNLDLHKFPLDCTSRSRYSVNGDSKIITEDLCLSIDNLEIKIDSINNSITLSQTVQIDTITYKLFMDFSVKN